MKDNVSGENRREKSVDRREDRKEYAGSENIISLITHGDMATEEKNGNDG